MWSTRNLPDEIYECEQIYDIEKEFDLSITGDDALEIYNMDFDRITGFLKISRVSPETEDYDGKDRKIIKG